MVEIIEIYRGFDVYVDDVQHFYYFYNLENQKVYSALLSGLKQKIDYYILEYGLDPVVEVEDPILEDPVDLTEDPHIVEEDYYVAGGNIWYDFNRGHWFVIDLDGVKTIFYSIEAARQFIVANHLKFDINPTEPTVFWDFRTVPQSNPIQGIYDVIGRVVELMKIFVSKGSPGTDISRIVANTVSGILGNASDYEFAKTVVGSTSEDLKNMITTWAFSRLAFDAQTRLGPEVEAYRLGPDYFDMANWRYNSDGTVYRIDNWNELEYDPDGYLYNIKYPDIPMPIGDSLAIFRGLNNLFYGLSNLSQNYGTQGIPSGGTGYDAVVKPHVEGYWQYSKVGGPMGTGWLKSKFGSYYVRKNILR